jgi:D-3-phosphoglycerate dehydrogenase
MISTPEYHPPPVTVAVASRSFSNNATLRRELLERYPDAKFNLTNRVLWRDEFVEFLRGYHKAITGLETLDDAVFSAVPELRVVSKYGVGLDMIDLEAARRHGVAVRWTPGVNRQAVAELAIAMMIALARQLMPLAREVGEGVWQQPVGRELSSATVGIVGCGHVGQQVARICRAFGSTVLAHDIVSYDHFYRANGVVAVAREHLLRDSDIVSIHLPLDETTRGFIGSRELKTMKRSAFLINTARGGIVDEAALKSALIEGELAGAAADVFDVEPPPDRELLTLPNFLPTPHIGGSTLEAVLAMGRAAIDGLDDPSREIALKERVRGIPNE